MPEPVEQSPRESRTRGARSARGTAPPDLAVAVTVVVAVGMVSAHRLPPILAVAVSTAES
ncbi:hypothetical protein GCM10027444_31290 [Actinopolyspora lacussalsi]